MIKSQQPNTTYRWEICPKEENPSRWSTPYATINPEGHIVITRRTHEGLGAPDSYLLLFAREANVIGIKPARPMQPNAFPARMRGRHGGRRIKAYRLLREFGITVSQTMRFPRAHINRDGILILDLKDVKYHSTR